MGNAVSMRDRALTVLNGGMPVRFPFITRLEAWYKSHTRTSTLPAHLRGLTLDEVHHSLGVGRLQFCSPFGFRLRGVEVNATFNGEPLYHEYEPIIENFPGMWDIVPTDRAGETLTDLITPRGRLTLKHRLLPENIESGTDPHLQRHLLEKEDDFAVLAYILDKAECVPLPENVRNYEIQVGEHGLVVPLLYRIPFQQLLLEYFGEIPLFRALHSGPGQVRWLLDLLDDQLTGILQQMGALDVPYVEFPDNLHGPMTSPRLFEEFCLPAYQKYCEILHAQGKKVGSHTDGDMRPLLHLLPETGLDVCESFSPYPLTGCTFEAAWHAWEHGPLIWGAIPSPILEERCAEADFHDYMRQLYDRLDRPIILGVVDLFMRHNSIERVAAIASWVEAGEIPGLELNKHEN